MSEFGTEKFSLPSRKNGRALGKRDCLSRIEDDLADVRLDLREVGIHRRVDREIRRDTPRTLPPSSGFAAV